MTGTSCLWTHLPRQSGFVQAIPPAALAQATRRPGRCELGPRRGDLAPSTGWGGFAARVGVCSVEEAVGKWANAEVEVDLSGFGGRDAAKLGSSEVTGSRLVSESSESK